MTFSTVLRLACSAVALAAAAECGGPNITEKRNVSNFSGVTVAASITVGVEAGEFYDVTVAGFENLLSQLESDVDAQGMLVLELKPGACNSNIVVKVTVPQPLGRVDAAKGGRVVADKAAGSLSASGGSSISVDELEAKDARLDASGQSTISVASGRVESVSAKVSSGSEMALGELEAKVADVSAASRSTFSGLRAESVTVSVSSMSKVSIADADEVAYDCSSGSELTLPADARVTDEESSVDCRIQTRKEQAAVFLP